MTAVASKQGSFVIAIDVGNSAVKIAARPIGESATAETDSVLMQTFLLQQADEKNGCWMDAVCDWIESNVANNSVQCWVSTVNRAASEPLRRQIAKRFAGAAWKEVSFQTVPMVIDVDTPNRVGIDRLVGGFAASTLFDDPVVVVDAGSAVTIDWIGRRDQESDEVTSVFSGGAILPGIRLQLAALANGTEAIEHISFDVPATDGSSNGQFLPAKNTRDAIRLGVIAGLVGSVERLAADYGEQSPTATPKIVITGGDAQLISRHLDLPHVVVPQLVCDGLIQLAMDTLRK